MALAEAAAAASAAASLDAARAAAQAPEREKLVRAELVALGRDTCGDLPYFDDLGLASDESFLLALGRCATLGSPSEDLASSAAADAPLRPQPRGRAPVRGERGSADRARARG